MADDVAQRISLVISRLEALATDDRIRDAAEILWSADPASWQKFAASQALAGSYAWAKTCGYITELRAIETKRRHISVNIRHAFALLDDESWVAEHIDEAADIKVRTWFWGGQQEVLCHLFTICATKIHKYLPEAALPARATIPKDDLAFLHTFTSARNHFEHPEQSLPGKRREHVLVERTEDSFVVGLRTDNQGRLLIDGVPIEISAQGFKRIEDIVGRALINIDHSCVTEVQLFLQEHPDLIPDPESIGRTLAIDLDRGRP